MAVETGTLYKLDSRLVFRMAANDEAGDPDERVTVLVHTVGDLTAVKAAGLWTDWTIGPVTRGTVAFGDLAAVAALDDVRRVEVPGPGRLHIHDSVPEIHGDKARKIPPGFDGTGVIVGVVDTGVDIFHHAFRNDNGTTRIVSLFDQTMRHKFTITGQPSAGTFTLKFTGPPPTRGAERPAETTGPITLPVTAAQFQATLEALTLINPGDITVTGGQLPAAPIVVDFVGRYDPRVVDSELLGFEIASGSLTPTAGGDPNPALSYTTGRNFTPEEINAALAAGDEGFPSKDRAGHGTHCLGIAAGDSSQAGGAETQVCCRHAGYYIGVAPRADLVVVKSTVVKNDDWALGAQHVLEQTWRPAGTAVKPAVVSLSLGSALTSHDGTDSSEQMLDALVAHTTGRAVVVSAGNDGEIVDTEHPALHPQNGGGIHGAKTVLAGKSETFQFVIQEKDIRADLFEIWYAGAGRLTFNLTMPAGRTANPPFTPVVPGTPAQTVPIGDHRVQIVSSVSRPQNGKHRIAFFLSPPPGAPITNDIWTITLTETAGTATPVDCWIRTQDDDPHPRWVTLDQRRQNTIHSPGTAQNVITVGAYDPSNGKLGEFSARGGPVVNGRPKPDLTAPGVGIVAAKNFARDSCWRPDCCVNFYIPESGTSSAAPHVAGTIALMFQANPNLDFDQIRTILTTTCRKPSPDPGLPNTDWGAGKVDAEQAVRKSLPAAAAGEPITVSVTARADTYLPPAERLDALRRRAQASPTGRLLMALVSEHVDEARHLVNTDRRSLIAWHRMHGPGLLRLLLGSSTGDVPVPAEHDGQPIAAGLGRLLDALAAVGSPPLRDAIHDHRAVLLSVPGANLADLDILEVH